MFGYSNDIKWETFSNQETAVLEALPHGSGIDANWHCEKLANGKLVCHNSYHVMDEWGGYRGWADFSIRFHVDTWADFRLMFHGKYSQYLNRQYQLRDYLEETIYDVVSYELEKETACHIE